MRCLCGYPLRFIALAFCVSISACSSPRQGTIEDPSDSAFVAIEADADLSGVAEAQASSCHFEPGFRISRDSIGPIAVTDAVARVMELCPRATIDENTEIAFNVLLGTPILVIPVPDGVVMGAQIGPRRDALQQDEPLSLWYVSGDGSLPGGVGMDATLADLTAAYGPGTAAVLDGRLSFISVRFGLGFDIYVEEVPPPTLEPVDPTDPNEFDVVYSSVPDSLTIRAVQIPGGPGR